MENLLNKMRKQKGYLSIEAIVVAGLVIGLGAVGIAKFQTSSSTVTDGAISTVSKVQSKYAVL